MPLGVQPPATALILHVLAALPSRLVPIPSESQDQDLALELKQAPMELLLRCTELSTIQPRRQATLDAFDVGCQTSLVHFCR